MLQRALAHPLASPLRALGPRAFTSSSRSFARVLCTDNVDEVRLLPSSSRPVGVLPWKMRAADVLKLRVVTVCLHLPVAAAGLRADLSAARTRRVPAPDDEARGAEQGHRRVRRSRCAVCDQGAGTEPADGTLQRNAKFSRSCVFFCSLSRNNLNLQVTPELLQHCKRMKIIGRAGVGVDNIDVTEATRKGIMVMNTPGGNTVSTAQLAMSLLCSVARKIPQGERFETHTRMLKDERVCRLALKFFYFLAGSGRKRQERQVGSQELHRGGAVRQDIGHCGLWKDWPGGGGVRQSARHASDRLRSGVVQGGRSCDRPPEGGAEPG